MDTTWLGRLPRLLVLSVGPLATAAFAESQTSTSSGLALLAVLIWSPLFFSVPALLLQNERDAALAHLTGPAGSVQRAGLLLPHLLIRPGVRTEMVVSLAGWMLVLAAAGGPAWALLAGTW